MSFKKPTEEEIRQNLNGAMQLYGSTAESEALTQRKQDSELRAARVWNALKQMYGSSFLSIYGDNPNSAWIRALAGVTDEQCKRGLANLVRSGGEFPPTLPKFIDACCRLESPRFLGVPIKPKSITHQSAPMSLAQKHLANMREKVDAKPKRESVDPVEEVELLSGAALELEKAKQLEALAEYAKERSVT